MNYALILVLSLLTDQSQQTSSLTQPLVLAKDYTSEEACEAAADAWRESRYYPSLWDVPEESKRLEFIAKCIPMPEEVVPVPSIYLPRAK